MKAEWQGRTLGGYPGLHHTAAQITRYIPKVHTYVEPFSGLARTAPYVDAVIKVLNDRSEYANNYCRKNFPKATITNEDFMDCIKRWDSEKTFFLVDPPWADKPYAMDHPKRGKLGFLDRHHSEYYKQFLEVAPTLKGDWILCSNWQRKIDTTYPQLIVTSTESNAIFGMPAKTLLVSNKPFKSYESLEGLLRLEI